jgi:phosphotransferase system HPr (HPr) family protein
MVKEAVRVDITLGLHARPVMKIINSLKDLNAKVIASNGNKEANLSSVMQGMLLAAPVGTILNVEADGPDEIKAMEAVKAVLAEKDL